MEFRVIGFRYFSLNGLEVETGWFWRVRGGGGGLASVNRALGKCLGFKAYL